MGEPGTYSTIIVIEQDRPSKRQRRLLHPDLGVVADCKSFRTKEARRMREWVTGYFARAAAALAASATNS